MRRCAVVAASRRPRGPARPRSAAVYGTERIDLAKRAGQKRGWQTGLFTLYGRPVLKTYKTFLATYKPVGGVLRVVLVREPSLGGVLRHVPEPERGDDPRGGGRPRGAVAGVPRREGGSSCRSAAVASCVGEREGVELDPVVAYTGGVMGLAPSARRGYATGVSRRGTRRSAAPRTPTAAGSSAARAGGGIFPSSRGHGLRPKIRRFIRRLC